MKHSLFASLVVQLLEEMKLEETVEYAVGRLV
jgi:hypothetical protein